VGIDPDPLLHATRALQHRDRSAREIDERLARAGVGDEARADALETLERLGYLDDERFATGRADALAARGHGDASIRADLAAHGVAAELVETAIGALEPEAERARALVARHGVSARTARRLAARGFAPEAVEAALGGNVAADGAEFL
jgi:regulatory protein